MTATDAIAAATTTTAVIIKTMITAVVILTTAVIIITMIVMMMKIAMIIRPKGCAFSNLSRSFGTDGSAGPSEKHDLGL